MESELSHISTRPQLSPVEMISYVLSQHLTFVSLKIWLNSLMSCVANCSWRRSSLVLMMQRKMECVLKALKREFSLIFRCFVVIVSPKTDLILVRLGRVWFVRLKLFFSLMTSTLLVSVVLRGLLTTIWLEFVLMLLEEL